MHIVKNSEIVVLLVFLDENLQFVLQLVTFVHPPEELLLMVEQLKFPEGDSKGRDLAVEESVDVAGEIEGLGLGIL